MPAPKWRSSVDSDQIGVGSALNFVVRAPTAQAPILPSGYASSESVPTPRSLSMQSLERWGPGISSFGQAADFKAKNQQLSSNVHRAGAASACATVSPTMRRSPLIELEHGLRATGEARRTQVCPHQRKCGVGCRVELVATPFPKAFQSWGPAHTRLLSSPDMDGLFVSLETPRSSSFSTFSSTPSATDGLMVLALTAQWYWRLASGGFSFGIRPYGCCNWQRLNSHFASPKRFQIALSIREIRLELAMPRLAHVFHSVLVEALAH